MTRMLAHPWPGNLRELKNRMERAAIVIRDEPIRASHLGLSPADNPECLPPPDAEGRIQFQLDFDAEASSLDAAVNQVLRRVPERCGGNKAKAAALLGVHRNMFYRRLSG